jgi:anti-anti-sigma factor
MLALVVPARWSPSFIRSMDISRGSDRMVDRPSGPSANGLGTPVVCMTAPLPLADNRHPCWAPSGQLRSGQRLTAARKAGGLQVSDYERSLGPNRIVAQILRCLFSTAALNPRRGGRRPCEVDMQKGNIPFRIRSEGNTDTSTGFVRVAGEIDVATAPILQNAILDQIRAGGRTVVDFAEVTFIDAAGVNALIRANQTAQDLGLQLTIAHVSGLVERVLRLTQADHILDIAPEADT